MRIVTAVMMMILIADVMVATALAATYIKVSDEKIGVVEEVSTELSVAEIKHEIQGIQNDLSRIESAKQPFLDRLAKYQELLNQCATLNITEPKISEPVEPINE